MNSTPEKALPEREETLRILAPVDRAAEVELLHGAGAHELYGGVRPSGWRWKAASPNQRTFASAQFESEEALEGAAREARRLGLPFHLTLNAPLYDPGDYPVLLDLAARSLEWGVTGLIVGDLGLLGRLVHGQHPPEVTLSTLAGAMNRESVAFFRRYPIRRVVLPRHLSLAEMASVVAAHPDLAFEAFVLVGKCPNEEAYCTFQHVGKDRRWPCEIPYALTDVDGRTLPGSHPLRRWHEQWDEVDRRHACGLCGLGELRRVGVRHLKIVGRGGPSEAKAANVRLVSRFLQGTGGRGEAREAYRERFGAPCHPLICYFPELYGEG